MKKKPAQKKVASKKAPAKKAKKAPAKAPPAVSPLDASIREAGELGAPLVLVSTVARPLGGGAVDVAGLGAGAFVSIGAAADVPRSVATALAAWGASAKVAQVIVAGDDSMLDAEASLSALASKLGCEVRFRHVPDLEVEAPNLARLATIDRGARRAFLTSVSLRGAPPMTVRIDPLALDDEASQRPVKLTPEGPKTGAAYRVAPSRGQRA